LGLVEREIARTPLDVDVLAWRARILMWSGHLADAETEYLKILQISRTDPDNWLGLAKVYLREGKTQEALHAVDTAVELDPNAQTCGPLGAMCCTRSARARKRSLRFGRP